MTFCLGIGYVAISIFPDRRSSLGRRPVTHLLPGMITWRHINVTLDDLAFALPGSPHPERVAGNTLIRRLWPLPGQRVGARAGKGTTALSGLAGASRSCWLSRVRWLRLGRGQGHRRG